VTLSASDLVGEWEVDVTRRPTAIDRHVGGRVRMRRLMVKMSQGKLGTALNVTFQQVQKYENGTNRISASRLQQIAGILGVSVEFFFDGAPAAPGAIEQAAPGCDAYLLTTDGLKLLRAYRVIKEKRIRQRLVEFMQAFSESELVREDHIHDRAFEEPR
jgi:transcriptional regulator with XRE-family HTH domain